VIPKILVLYNLKLVKILVKPINRGFLKFKINVLATLLLKNNDELVVMGKVFFI
jgi:hypothetical protein